MAPGAEGSGIYNLIQTQFTPAKLPSPPSRSWATAAPSRSPATAGAKVRATPATPSSPISTPMGQRVTDLENSPGVDPAADLTVNSLTVTSFVDTPQLQSAAGDLQIQNALVTVRRGDGALLASFADGGISLDRDVTVAAASTLNATTSISPNSWWAARPPAAPSTRAAASPPIWRSSAICGSRRRWCAAILPRRCSPYRAAATGFWWMTPCWSTGPSRPSPACRTCTCRAAPQECRSTRPTPRSRGSEPGRLLRAGRHHATRPPRAWRGSTCQRREGRAGGAGRRRRAAQRVGPVHRLQHHLRPGEPRHPTPAAATTGSRSSATASSI